MDLPFFQIDAFTSRTFGGNPAAVIILEYMLDDELLQSIAAENNLSETAFLLKQQGDDSRLRYHLRWFTPKQEVDLCGHATLASAHALFEEQKNKEILFETLSGTLIAKRNNDKIQLDFPSRPPKEMSKVPHGLTSLAPIGAFASRDLVLLFEDEEDIHKLVPNYNQITKCDFLGVIATAPGNECDFVSRFFAPKVGVPEDPVTGSAHATLTPFWSDRLGKTKLSAIQLSKRRGELDCEMNGNRVTISGKCKSVINGHFTI